MKNKNENLLPKIQPRAGAICAQKVKCGKPGCKCSKGILHEGYYYRFFYKNGKLRKRYIKKADLKNSLAAYSAYKKQKRVLREEMEIANSKIRELRNLLKEYLK